MKDGSHNEEQSVWWWWDFLRFPGNQGVKMVHMGKVDGAFPLLKGS